jgi:hypothetical protein
MFVGSVRSGAVFNLAFSVYETAGAQLSKKCLDCVKLPVILRKRSDQRICLFDPSDPSRSLSRAGGTQDDN